MQGWEWPEEEEGQEHEMQGWAWPEEEKGKSQGGPWIPVQLISIHDDRAKESVS